MTPLIPCLISLLDPIPESLPTVEFDETAFVLASDTLQEVMAKSALSDGSGSKTLTEPLLLWFERHGGKIAQETHSSKLSLPDGDRHPYD